MFYDIFIELCARKGVKPSRAAEDCGINRSNVASWKKHGYAPRSEALNRIAAYFDVSADYLLGNKKEKPAKKADLDDNDIKFALFGTTDVDDETLEDIKAYARFKREQRKE